MECKHKAYRALVQPVLENACQVWNPHTKQSIITLAFPHISSQFFFILFACL